MKKNCSYIFIIFILLFTPSFVYAEIGGYSNSNPITTASDNTPTFGGLPVTCAGNGTSILRTTLSKKRNIPIPAVLVTVKKYNASTKVEQELAPGKIFYNNFGSNTVYYSCTRGNTPTQVGCTGGDHCTDSHAATQYNVSMFVLNYKSPTLSGSLQGKALVHTDVALDVNNLAGSLNNGGLVKILLGTNNISNLNMAQLVNGINSRMGTNMDINHIEDYYISVEPIIRQYGSLVTLHSHDSSFDLNGNETGDESNLDGGHYGEAQTHQSPPYSVGCDYGDAGCTCASTCPKCLDTMQHYCDRVIYEKGQFSGSGQCYDAHGVVSNDGRCMTAEPCCKNETSVPCECTKQVTDTCTWYPGVIKYNKLTYNNISTTLYTARDLNVRVNLLYNIANANSHTAVDDIGREINGKHDYFIGATYKVAMVGDNTNSENGSKMRNKYVFANSTNDTYDSSNPNKTIGLAIYALVDLININQNTCKDVCGYNSGNKSSDSYLQCAQSFCDASIDYNTDQFATTNKRLCIINNAKCGYVPNEPMDCDNPNSYYNTTFNSLPTGVNDGQNITGSYCGYSSATSPDRTGNALTKTGGYSQCKRVGDTSTQNVNGVEVYSYGDSNTQNTYINVACKELSSFDFKDISKMTLKRGEGFAYNVWLKGMRDCVLFFDYEQWKFDYAATHSLDTVRKLLLLNKLKAYNELNKAYSMGTYLNGQNLGTNVLNEETLYLTENGFETITVSQAIEYAEMESDSFWKIKNMAYNTDDLKSSGEANSKISVETQVVEYVKNNQNTTGNIPYSKDGTSDKISLDAANVSKVNSTNNGAVLTKIDESTVKLFNDYDEANRVQKPTTSTRKANIYSFYGTVDIDYEIPEVCVSETNSRTISKPVNGLCQSTRFGDSYGKRIFYTNFGANLTSSLVGNNNHHTETKVSVKKTDFDMQNTSSTYISGEDTCPYKIEESGNINCEIVINRSDACYNAENVYLSTSDNVGVRIIVNNRTSNEEEIVGYSMAYKKAGETNATVFARNTNYGNIPLGNLRFTEQEGRVVSNSRVFVIGTIKTRDTNGEAHIYTCNKTMTLAKDSNGCTINKESSNNRYEISYSGNEKVYITTGNLQNTMGNLVFNEVKPTSSGKYYVYNLNPNGNEIVIAKIGNSYCTYKPTNCPSNCKDACDENDVRCNRNYCASEGLNDGYYYFPSCESYCVHETLVDKLPCDDIMENEIDKEDYQKVESWCTTNLSLTSHLTVDECIRSCYKSSGIAKYRPVNLNNPFPSSSYSYLGGYDGGEREIGKDWKINYKTINEDKDSINSGEKIEYLIDLDPSTIKAIKNNTRVIENGLSETSVYTTTGNSINMYNTEENHYYQCTKNANDKAYTGYCSSFLHNDFRNVVKILDGRVQGGDSDE